MYTINVFRFMPSIRYERQILVMRHQLLMSVIYFIVNAVQTLVVINNNVILAKTLWASYRTATVL